MADKAVFLDRDHTMIETSAYLTDPSAVRLLPGVEMALKSLIQADYKLVLATNQPGVARGLLSEETVQKIHAEISRQLAERDVHLDAIYYCPYHPEGNVEPYAQESELRKPNPGMLLQAEEDLDVELSESWMIGNSGRDIEAGQRAGCRTVRLRGASPSSQPVQDAEELQADFTVRNLVDAARVILREDRLEDTALGMAVEPAAPTPHAQPTPEKFEQAEEEKFQQMNDTAIRLEILRHLRQLVRARDEDEFSIGKLIGSIIQVLALLGMLIGAVKMIQDDLQAATLWFLIALVLQVLTLTTFAAQKK